MEPSDAALLTTVTLSSVLGSGGNRSVCGGNTSRSRGRTSLYGLRRLQVCHVACRYASSPQVFPEEWNNSFSLSGFYTWFGWSSFCFWFLSGLLHMIWLVVTVVSAFVWVITHDMIGCYCGFSFCLGYYTWYDWLLLWFQLLSGLLHMIWLVVTVVSAFVWVITHDMIGCYCGFSFCLGYYLRSRISDSHTMSCIFRPDWFTRNHLDHLGSDDANKLLQVGGCFPIPNRVTWITRGVMWPE